jgi:hypothetical protein
LHHNDATTIHTIEQFGSAMNGNDPQWKPQEGNKMLIISTGTLDDPNNGVLTQDPGVTHMLNLGPNRNKTKNPDNQKLPLPMHAENGSGGMPFSDCDCVNDCSDTLWDQWVLGDEKANDLLWFTFELNVPGGTYGYEFDFAWFSAEYPEWVDTKYNDVFVVWSTSESYTGNITFINDQPLTVTALKNDMKYGPDHAALAGTGFDGSDEYGGATGWYTALGSASPYETFSLTWAIFDMGDNVLDTAVLIDNWRWSCGGCIPSDEDSCGIKPQ